MDALYSVNIYNMSNPFLDIMCAQIYIFQMSSFLHTFNEMASIYCPLVLDCKAIVSEKMVILSGETKHINRSYYTNFKCL